MAVRGTQAKEDFIKLFLQAFPAAFKYDKEYRLPIYDGTSGETVQLKIAITCAKDCVEGGGDTAVPTKNDIPTQKITKSSADNFVEPSEEEINSMKALLNKFNL